jgi:hypothetical protein
MTAVADKPTFITRARRCIGPAHAGALAWAGADFAINQRERQARCRQVKAPGGHCSAPASGFLAPPSRNAERAGRGGTLTIIAALWKKGAI